MCTLLDEKTRRARKPHECYACGAVINPGEEYFWEKYVNCDGLYELKSCLACDMAFPEVWNYVGEWRCISDEGITFEDYREWATDPDDDDTPAKQAWRQRAGYTRENEDAE